MRNFCLALAALICSSCMAQEPHVILKGERFTVDLAETAEQQALGIEQGTVIADPLFYDAENGDLRLKPESPALETGFVPFDVEFGSFGVDSSYPARFRKLDDAALKTRTIPSEPKHH